jgi:hypothetical protein
VDTELDLLLGTAIDSLLKLNLLLDLYARPEAVEAPAALATRLNRPLPQTARALEQLAQAGLIEKFSLGTGRLVLFGAAEEEHIRQLMEALRLRHSGPAEGRVRLVRRILHSDTGD